MHLSELLPSSSASVLQRGPHRILRVPRLEDLDAFTNYDGAQPRPAASAAAGPVTLSTTKYYKALGRTIAMRTSSANDITYLLSDQLGSTTTTMTNGVIAKESYYPYGATRSTTGTIPTDRLFTGQRQEPSDALGLYNYGARFYSTAIGQFVSADSVTTDGLNRYAYARGNPVRYTDPTGHCVWEDSNCSPDDMLRFIQCGFGDGCGNNESSALERSNLFILSRWMFRQQAFFNRVSLFAMASESFYNAVVSHRLTYIDYMTDNDIYFYEKSGELRRGPAPIPGGFGQGPGFPDVKDMEFAARLQTIRIDYSYLDLKIYAGGSPKEGGGVDFRVYVNVDGSGWQGYGFEGGSPIDFSMFDRRHDDLQVSLDVASVRNLGRPVLYDVQGSTFSPPFSVQLCLQGTC